VIGQKGRNFSREKWYLESRLRLFFGWFEKQVERTVVVDSEVDRKAYLAFVRVLLKEDAVSQKHGGWQEVRERRPSR
jgi:hypothetical protein